jgi:hypothetical protein
MCNLQTGEVTWHREQPICGYRSLQEPDGLKIIQRVIQLLEVVRQGAAVLMFVDAFFSRPSIASIASASSLRLSVERES